MTERDIPAKIKTFGPEKAARRTEERKGKILRAEGADSSSGLPLVSVCRPGGAGGDDTGNSSTIDRPPLPGSRGARRTRPRAPVPRGVCDTETFRLHRSPRPPYRADGLCG